MHRPGQPAVNSQWRDGVEATRSVQKCSLGSARLWPTVTTIRGHHPVPACTEETMTETVTLPGGEQVPSPHIPRPHTDGDALRAIDDATSHLKQRAEEIREHPGDHLPKLVLSKHVRGTSLLDRIADAVNVFCGSMYVFIGITVGIVAWLFLGNVVGFDKTPWPLLLTLLTLPQLSIMISLQVSANRAQTASDARAIADHETLIALHEMGKQQIAILNGQNEVLAMLKEFASKDLPGRQERIEDTASKILAIVSSPGPGPSTSNST